ncbi:HlyD family efflux transporter periplasmic adaptor subunit [Acinetobacter sp. S40]|uniref:HlyD family efflux transporter periplasmic adaptor subunit n=1 Tax=unclassified Acinetobacter TaxID=196816 RepID=UPI00190E0767|nr:MULTISPECIES: HlyD family efflux transporter periplasmic adaptor subunit [unclassified Acinetobacter]MBJ9985848.1 HlyD family efflux transporter periplasmic adaptor subunit [Acinetobacter sp. S40]MBK0063629.1 HlyD family efflux transporter periplasmic adaptor subunit [Acinetobacter sp. S55]MBK0067507.1 HlyD family efflux transporter periplasmic adaptor subunit [Acinetobacter sp. S54]
MKKGVVATLLVVLILALAFAAYWYWNKDKPSEHELTLYGNVDIRQVSLAFEQAGRIQRLNVQEGDKVQQGQVLAELNTDALKIQAQQAKAQLNVQKQAVIAQDVGTRPEQITQAKAQLTSAQAQLEKASKDFQRLQLLNNSTAGQAISKQELDLARTSQATAAATVKEQQANLVLLEKGARAEDRAATKAQYEASQANLNLIEYQITQSILRAPVNAVVRARLQEVGDMTTAQKTVYTLALTDPKWVRVYANEQQLGLIKMGNQAQVIRDSQPNQPISGKIGYISSVAEFTPKTVQTEDIRTTLVYEVRVYVNDPDDQLKMGQPVTVKIAKAD